MGDFTWTSFNYCFDDFNWHDYSPTFITNSSLYIWFRYWGAMPGLIAWTLDRTSVAEFGLAVSTFYFIYEIGMFFGLFILGILLEIGNYYSFLVIAAIILIVMLYYLYSLRQEKIV